MATSKPPTPQGVSALLKRAGFKRSTYGDKGVMWNEASDGFSVWKSHHQNAPQQPYIAVQYIARTLRDTGAEWGGTDGIKAEMLVRLGEFATVIENAGYHPVVRDRGDEPPWLTILTVVTAGKAGQ